MNAQNVNSTEIEVNFRSEDWFFQDVERRAEEKLKMRPGMIYDAKNEKSQEWQREMGQHFEYMQRSVGIDENSFKITIDNRSDNVFRTLHPKCKHPFRKIIESQSLYNKMKSMPNIYMQEIYSKKRNINQCQNLRCSIHSS